jgi:hypothetical protein
MESLAAAFPLLPASSLIQANQVAACFLSYVEDKPNTNIAALRKTGHAKGRSHARGGM